MERIGVFRFSLGLVFMMLAIYLTPGMRRPREPHQRLPPSDVLQRMEPRWRLGESGGHGGHVEGASTTTKKVWPPPKPKASLLLDFTGWACVNCRKMEEQVWSDSVAKLTEDVVLVSLYVDDRTALPEDERVEQYGGKDFRIKTVGNKWSYLQASRFNRNAQPFYVMIDHDGNHIGGSAGYDPDAELFLIP